MRNFVFPLVALALSLSACTGSGLKVDKSLPNIIVIYCDDLGYGDLACFGSETIRTPNIDRMADEGMKFTEFYSASSVCSPSRAALLTGRIPQRMGISGVFFPRSFTGMPTDEITTAELLKTAGYATGIVGKWHLGHREKYLPMQRGFDEYFGIPYSNDMHSAVYIEGNEVVDFHPDQHFTTKTYTEKTLDFIERHSDGPFYLYLAHSMPHVPIYASPEFDGRSGKGLYVDVIEELDWSVGEVLAKLEEEGVLSNTLVVFSSDNGPWLAMREHGGSAGPLREGKMFTFEGGQRVPTLALWPGVIAGGSVFDDLALMTDWHPTFAEIAGVELPSDRDYDGESILNILNASGERTGREFLYYDNFDLQCYRNGDWKIKLPYQGFPGANWKKAVAPHDTLLFNLKDDPGEMQDLFSLKPDKVAEMVSLMQAYVRTKGTYPPAIDIGMEADDYHYRYLEEKHGKRFNYVDWSEIAD